MPFSEESGSDQLPHPGIPLPDHDGEEKYEDGSRTSPLLKGGADEDERGTFSLTGVGLEEGMKILNDKRDDDEGELGTC